MPRKCQVDRCDERGTHLEGWTVPFFDRPVVVWFCDTHSEASFRHTAEKLADQFDGAGGGE